MFNVNTEMLLTARDMKQYQLNPGTSLTKQGINLHIWARQAHPGEIWRIEFAG